MQALLGNSPLLSRQEPPVRRVCHPVLLGSGWARTLQADNLDAFSCLNRVPALGICANIEGKA